MSGINRQWIIKGRPKGEIQDTDLVFESSAAPVPLEGEVIVRTEYLSLDPANRLWMNEDPVYMPPLQLGRPMMGLVMGTVSNSATPEFRVGDRVMGVGTWSEYVRGQAAQFNRVPEIDGVSARDVFAIFIAAIPTAYFGVKDVVGAKAGETIVVSGAAGAVGSLAGQFAKALGCRVIGIAGGKEKCQMLTELYGMDASIDYKQENVGARLDALCPSGIDGFFDNVAGDVLDAVLLRMNHFGRIAQCGAISTYNQAQATGPKNYGQIVYRRLKVQGFIVFDFIDRYPESYEAGARLHAEGRLQWRLQEESGLDQALTALRKLYTGQNLGKQLVRVAA